MKTVTYILTVILTVGMSLLVSLMVARKNKSIDMVYGRGAEMSGISSRTGDAKANGRETAMRSFPA
jgi:uncharacterized MAPEG superfamily protein